MATVNVRLRTELHPSDAARCAELEAQLFDGDDPWPAVAFLRELAAPHIHYVAARADDKLVGYGGIARLGRMPPYEYEIHTIGVDPAYQGQGIGRQMLNRLLEFAADGAGLPRGAHRQRGRDRAVRERSASSTSDCASATTGSAAPTPTRCNDRHKEVRA